MEPATLSVTVTAALGILGLFGGFYNNIRKRITSMEIEIYKRPDFADSRRIVADKLAPIHVEYTSLTKRMDELKDENDQMNNKIDKLLVICTKLSHQK